MSDASPHHQVEFFFDRPSLLVGQPQSAQLPLGHALCSGARGRRIFPLDEGGDDLFQIFHDDVFLTRPEAGFVTQFYLTQ